MLESLLKDQGVVPPPAAHPPKTRHEPPSKQSKEVAAPSGSEQQILHTIHVTDSPPVEANTPDFSGNDELNLNESDHTDSKESFLVGTHLIFISAFRPLRYTRQTTKPLPPNLEYEVTQRAALPGVQSHGCSKRWDAKAAAATFFRELTP